MGGVDTGAYQYVLVATFGRGGRDRPRSGGKNNNFLFYFLLLCHRKNYLFVYFSNAMAKIQPAHLDLMFSADVDAASSSKLYVNVPRELSKINRRMYECGRLYAIQGLTYVWRATPGGEVHNAVATLEVTARTAGNTWVVQNAFVKGKALWHEMQDLVLKDNPSIKGTWHDYKVQLSTSMTGGRTLDCVDGAGAPYLAGEWDLSTYVMPQHEVDPGTGEPLAAEEFTAVLIGDDDADQKSLVKAYALSRATVQEADPFVPAGMSGSFFNLLTDSGSQEPELADVIELENDFPPYSRDDYPGTAANAGVPVTVAYGAISSAEVDGRLPGFVAPCGLIELEIKGYDSNGDAIANGGIPPIDVIVHVAPGMYKGCAAIAMGQ